MKNNMQNLGITITEKMKTRADEEARKRNEYIKHHFEVDHLSYFERDRIGFLGEFACCELLGIDWEDNIRENYLSIDSGDLHLGKFVFDVKTETIPSSYFQNVISRQINDDLKYGRRLIMENQVPLLKKYDGVIFGAFERNYYDKWYSIGFIGTEYVLSHYQIVKKAPYGAIYPQAAMPIRTSELGQMNRLIHYANRLKSLKEENRIKQEKD